jgi:hydroxymethylpyrimidine pyrophosphatase-like HAD family hydrolase
VSRTAAPRGQDGPRPDRFRLVATDLDGTLLRGDLTVSERTRRALRLVRDAGARHVVVTGRPASGCRWIPEVLGYRGIMVCGQGAQLYHAGEHRLLTAVSLDRQVARSAVARITAAVGPVSLAVLTAGLEGRFVVGPGYALPGEFPSCTEVAEDALWDEPIEKVLLRRHGLHDDVLADTAAALCGPYATAVLAADRQVELLPAGVDKAAGLARAAALLGLGSADTVAFGDMPNDLPMLRWAGHAVAMGNAHPKLLAEADEVAPSNAEDGVAAVLERLFTPRPAPGGSSPVTLESSAARRPGPADGLIGRHRTE